MRCRKHPNCKYPEWPCTCALSERKDLEAERDRYRKALEKIRTSYEPLSRGNSNFALGLTLLMSVVDGALGDSAKVSK